MDTAEHVAQIIAESHTVMPAWALALCHALTDAPALNGDQSDADDDDGDDDGEAE